MVTQTPDTFNPLDEISPDSEDALDDVRALAESQVVRTGHENDPHWNDSAEAIIAAIAAAVVSQGDPDDRSLQTVRSVLTNPATFEAVTRLLCASTAWDGMLARMGTMLTYYKDKELNSTLTTTNRHLKYLDTPAVAASTKTSSFDPDELLGGKMDVFLVLPPQHARTLAPLLRMWISSLLRVCVRGGLQEANKVHFVLDEFATLGHLDCIDQAIDKLRGYGVRMQFYLQSLGQLKVSFPDGQDQTFLSNVSQVFFAVNDPQTAEYISTRLGDATIVTTSGGTSTGTSRQRSGGDNSTTTSTNANDNWQQSARRLLKPEEVMGLPARTAITFTPGVPPVLTTLTRYYEEPPGGRGPFREAARTLAISLLYFLFACALALAVARDLLHPRTSPRAPAARSHR
jgi:type IV secretion system protein VirD4